MTHKILITGGAGFIGSHLAELLLHQGHWVVAIDNLSTGRIENMAHLRPLPHFQFVRETITNAQVLDRLASQADIIIHLAAAVGVQLIVENPVHTIETNVMGTVNLFEASKNCDSVEVVINVTSDKCYENKEWVWGYREDDPMGGHDPYSASKGAAELVTSAYRNSFFAKASVRVASVRAGNVIGGGDWSEARLVPDIFRAFARGEKVHLRHPKAVRAWQHVLDPVRGYLMLAERLWENDGAKFADGWNFGPPPEEIHDVETVTRLFAKRWGSGAGFEIEKNAAAPHEAGLLLLDSARANEFLGWKPRLSFEQSLEWTTDWYRAFYEGKNDMRAFSLSQIERFASGAA